MVDVCISTVKISCINSIMKSGATHYIDTNYLSFIYYTKSNPVHHFRVVNNILSLILDNSYTLVNMGVEVIEKRVS